MKCRHGTRRCARGRIGHRGRERTEPSESGSKRRTGIRASSSGSRGRRGSGGDDGGGGEHGVHEAASEAPRHWPVKRRIPTARAPRRLKCARQNPPPSTSESPKFNGLPNPPPRSRPSMKANLSPSPAPNPPPRVAADGRRHHPFRGCSAPEDLPGSTRL